MNFSLREWKRYRKLTLLIEGRIDDARRAAPIISAVSKLAMQANPNEPDFIDNVVAFDPTGNQKYLVWTVKAMEKNIRDSMSDRILDAVIEYAETGHEGLGPDDVTSIQRAAAEDWGKVWRLLINRYGLFKDIIQDFHKFVKRKIIRGEEADINKYADWSALDARNEQAREELDEKAKQKRLRKSIDVIHADDEWFIFEPLTYEASCHYAQRYGERNTRWCISSDDYPQYWKEFSEADNKFVFVFSSKNRKFSIQNNEWDGPQTIAGHEANAGTTVWDEDDDPMSFNQFRRVSGIPTDLAHKIEAHYSNEHGLTVHDDMHDEDEGPMEEFNLMQSYAENIREEKDAAAFTDLQVELYFDQDDRETTLSQLSFALPIPKEFFVTTPDSYAEIENDDLRDAIEELINKYEIDGYGGYVTDIRIGHVSNMLVNIGVMFSSDQSTFSSYNEFSNWLDIIVRNLNWHAFYEPTERPDATELPDLIGEILVLFKIHTPEDMRSIGVEIPDYENFELDLSDGSKGDMSATSAEIKFVESEEIVKTALRDPRYDGSLGTFRNEAERAFTVRLLNWIAEGIATAPEQGELPLSESQEVAQRMARYFTLLGKYMDFQFRWKVHAEGYVLVTKIVTIIPVVPHPGSYNEKIRMQAVEFMDSNWSAVRQIAAQTIYNMVKDAGPPEIEEKPGSSLEEKKNLTEVKKKRKIRIKFR